VCVCVLEHVWLTVSYSSLKASYRESVNSLVRASPLLRACQTILNLCTNISFTHTELFVCKQSLLTYQGLEFINDLTALQQTHWHKQQRAAMFVRFLDVRDISGQTSAWHDTVITMTGEMTRQHISKISTVLE